MEITSYNTINQAINLIGPGLAMTFANPFELVRFRMQTMPELLRQGALSFGYKGVIDCGKRVFKQEGLRAFWKGNLTNLLRFYPSQTINFALKQFIQKTSKISTKFNSMSIPVKNAVSGIIGGWLTLIFLYPFDYSRLKLSNDISGKNGGIYQTLKTTYKIEGLKAIYRGAQISFFGVGIFRGVYFGIFDTFKWRMSSYLQMLLLGYTATFIAIFLTYPSDTIRRRLMMTSCQNYKYNGFFDCCKKVFKKQGTRGFFRGGSIMFFQSFAGAFILCLYEKFARDFVGRSQWADI